MVYRVSLDSALPVSTSGCDWDDVMTTSYDDKRYMTIK